MLSEYYGNIKKLLTLWDGIPHFGMETVEECKFFQASDNTLPNGNSIMNVLPFPDSLSTYKSPS